MLIWHQAQFHFYFQFISHSSTLPKHDIRRRAFIENIFTDVVIICGTRGYTCRLILEFKIISFQYIQGLDLTSHPLLILRPTGLRDDLMFLLDEELSSINLCSLHCEMRNCEQLLGSLGLFAYRVGSLDELNQALSDHGPESCKGFPRVTVKLKPGQETDVERKNIKVASFSGLLIICL